MTALDRQAKHAKMFIAMELDIHDLERMARASEMLLDLYREQKTGFAEASLSAKELVVQIEQWSDMLDFSVRHVADMAKALRRKYQE